jgi:type IV pilus assembly protein PilV
MKIQRRTQLGVSMIEVLVSLAVVAFGLLGLAGLQARSMSYHKDSLDRKAAAEMAAQLAERVRANYNGFRAGNYNQVMQKTDPTPVNVAACATVQDCTPLEIANRDQAMWQIELRRRLPVSAAFLVTPPNPLQMTITVAWQEGQLTDGQADPNCGQLINDPTFRCLNWTVHP